MRPIVFALLLMFTATPAAQAQQPVPPDGETDVADLIRAWRNKEPPPPSDPRKRMIVAAPIIGSNPSAGFLLGAAAKMAVFRGKNNSSDVYLALQEAF
jgi:hypothetical protein